MGGAYRRAPGDSLQPIADDIRAVRERVGRQETASGTSLSNLVDQVKTAIVGITAQVTAAVAAMPSITVAGNITSTGADVVAAQSLRGQNIYATQAPTYNITGGRVTAWWETATGRGGFAPSSRELKTDIELVELERMRRILAIGIYHYAYIAEVRKRDDPDYEGYVGPNHHVGTNLGTMAEELHDAGLWEFVVYEREEDGATLKLDVDGQPHPIAVHDVLMAYAVIPVVQDHDARISAIEGHLGIGGNS